MKTAMSEDKLLKLSKRERGKMLTALTKIKEKELSEENRGERKKWLEKMNSPIPNTVISCEAYMYGEIQPWQCKDVTVSIPHSSKMQHRKDLLNKLGVTGKNRYWLMKERMGWDFLMKLKELIEK